jgi:hypothetical protein
MPGCLFIGSKGERDGRASERNGWQRWCSIMAMKAAISEGDRAVSNEGEWNALAVMGVEGRGAPRGSSARVSWRRWRRGRAAGGGRRRGGAHSSVRERERERDGLGRADRETKAQEEWGVEERAGRRPRPRRLGRKPKLGTIQEIKPFQILFEIWIFGKL